VGSASLQTVVLPAQGVGVACAPSVRRFARELGVNVADVPSTHPRGRITIEDVKAHVKKMASQSAVAGGQVRHVPLPDFSKFGVVREEAMSTIRARTAEHMAAAWSTIPHVTQHAHAKIDALELVRRKLAQRFEKDAVRLTLTTFLVKIVALTLKRNPKFNSSIDVENKKVIYKDFVNIGVAVDTDKGLLVPVVRDADKKSIGQIAKDLALLSEKARAGKLSPDDMVGGTFTISNLGSIGGGYFTPIVNAPEVAILGVSRTVQECVPGENGTPGFAAILPLSLSYDHRLIDGADGARFVMALVELIEDPHLMLLN
jgi:pyruvate dehydrogenase E2 component (dihydrolipoamide acetyltransferase)